MALSSGTSLARNFIPVSIRSEPTSQDLSIPAIARVSPSIEALSAPHQADRTLLLDYCAAVRKGEHQINVPRGSTLAQWREQRAIAFENPQFKAWASSNDIELESVKLFPQSGDLHAKVKGTWKYYSLNDSTGWSSVAGPLLSASKKMNGPGHLSVTYGAVTRDQLADLKEIASFYGQSTIQFPPTLQHIATLEKNGSFVDPASPQKRDAELYELDLEILKQQLGDIQNRDRVSNTLTSLARGLNASDPDLKKTIQDRLQSQTLTPSPYSHLNPTGDSTQVFTLDSLINRYGWKQPASMDDLENLAKAITTAPPRAPADGNYTGALSWSVPLSTRDQRRIYYFLLNNYEEVHDKGALGFLTWNMQWDASELRQPGNMLKKIVESPGARALGGIIQEHLGSVKTPTSDRDHVLAAVQIFLNPDAVLDETSVSRNKFAGFNLAHQDHWGQPASKIVDKLTQHLINERIAVPLPSPVPSFRYEDGKKRASVEMAPVAARLLLASNAPEFLVKDIPQRVTYGSHSWVSFKTAVARLEAQAPGSTAAMSYAQVMLRASIGPITQEQENVEQAAQYTALKDWGVVNGIITSNGQDNYSKTEMEEVYKAYNDQLSKLSTASIAQSTDIPLYSEICLKELRRLLGDEIPLETKCISLRPSHDDYVGPYSLLDLFMSGEGFTYPVSSNAAQFRPTNTQTIHRWVSSDPDVNITEVLEKIDDADALRPNFGELFSKYSDDIESSINTQTRYLISQLPLEDRKNLEYGEISLYQERKLDIVGMSHSPRFSRANSDALIIKTKRHGMTKFYECDTKKGSITKRKLEDFTKKTWADSQLREFNLLKPVTPADRPQAGFTDERPSFTGFPKSFDSERSSYLAQAMQDNCSIRTLEAAARGVTTFDTDVPFHIKAREFVLDLIPLRSAIVNFTKGDLAAGIIDLGMDIFGFAVGLGAAARSVKGLSTAAKIFQSAKIIGRAALIASNPFDIIPAVAKGLYGLGKGTIKGIKTLTHFSDSYDLISASKKYNSTAIGTFNLGGHFVKGQAVLTNGKWHAFDSITRQPFGPVLDRFVPSMGGVAGEFKDWAVGNRVLTPAEEATKKNWETVVKQHKYGPNKDVFEAGYYSWKPRFANSRLKKLSPMEIMLQAKRKNVDSRFVGELVRQYDMLAFRHGSKGAAKFIDNIEPDFGTVFPMPQASYLSATTQFSDGQCAALSRAFATAMMEGKEKVLISNMYRASAYPTHSSSREFMQSLGKLQNQTGGVTAFHANKPLRQVTYQDMIKELSDSAVSKSVMIDSPRHAMAAGVIVNGSSKKFYFYDPNLGYAQFANAKAMDDGLTKLFNDKTLPTQYRTHGASSNTLEFKIFDHDDDWQTLNSIEITKFKKLYDAPLNTNSAASISHDQLKKNWAALRKGPDEKALVCHQVSVHVGQAEKSLLPEVYGAVKAAASRSATTNYTQQYLDLMGIKADSLKTAFNSADITESGILNFKHSREGEGFGHTVYIQKTNNNELYLFNANGPDLDVAMFRSGNKHEVIDGAAVYPLNDAGKKGLQNYLDGIKANDGWQFAYTPASTLNANVRSLRS